MKPLDTAEGHDEDVQATSTRAGFLKLLKSAARLSGACTTVQTERYQVLYLVDRRDIATAQEQLAFYDINSRIFNAKIQIVEVSYAEGGKGRYQVLYPVVRRDIASPRRTTCFL